MYELVLKNHKSINLNSKQFEFLKIIGQLGFLNYNQLTLLWSVISKTYSNFSHSMLRKWIKKYQLLRMRLVTDQKPSELSRPVYYLSPAGMRFLTNYNISCIPMKYLKFNSHNEQCNEVTLQSLFKATFDVDLTNNPYQKPIDNNLNHLIASSAFDLNKLDLRPWSKQVPNFKKYSFVPDQMITFTRNGQHCEIMIELDNRTEDNKVQLQKIFNYVLYAKDNPNKQILMVIAITDGSLPNFKYKRQRSVYNKINHLLTQFKNIAATYHNQKTTLASVYEETDNLLITVAGVSEAYVDLADFMINKSFSDVSITMLNTLADKLSQKFGKKVFFQKNKELNSMNLDYFSNRLQIIGYMVYNPAPAIQQSVILGYEHSLDTFLALRYYLPRNCIFTFPARPIKLLTPAIEDLYKEHPKQASFSHLQGMVYQPVLEDGVNPDLLIQLLFAKYHYYRYLYKFFTTGSISTSDKANYLSLTYLSSYVFNTLNQYLKGYQITLSDTLPRKYQYLQQIALYSASPKEFAQQLNPQDIPLEVLRSIFHQIPIRAFSSPYDLKPSTGIFNPLKYLYLPDTPNPKKRTKISF